MFFTLLFLGASLVLGQGNTTTATEQCPGILNFMDNSVQNNGTTTEFQVLSGQCTLSDGGRCVRSPNYPNAYNNEDCCTIFSPAGYLVATSFSVESGWDQLYVANAAYTGWSLPIIEIGEGGNIAWSTDRLAVSDGWEICWSNSTSLTTTTATEQCPELLNFMDNSVQSNGTITEFQVLSGQCTLSDGGRCVRSPNYPNAYNNEDCCAILSPAGYLVASSFSVESGFDHLYVANVAYTGWSLPIIEIGEGGNIAWSTDPSVARDGWEICVFCNVSGNCVTSPTTTTAQDTMITTTTAQDTMTTTTSAEDTTLTTTAQDFMTTTTSAEDTTLTTTAQDTMITTTSAETTTFTTTTTQDTVTATTGAEDTTTATPSAILVLGSFSFSMDSAGQVRLCESTAEAKQAVMDGANAVSTFNITIEQVTSTTVSPCPSRRLAAKRALQDVDVSLDFEISFEDSALATLFSEEINGEASSFADAMATSLDDSLGVTVSNVQVEVTQTTVTVPGYTGGVAGAATNMLAIVVIVLSSFFRVADP